ncbi:mannan endo-1,4-beta-mannosidase [Alteromonadaceae bacterium 2753L.S.0a.02]|nr:mannan endo-1,4-beta-mannosidase [Alteromonadaceae bacterium 2753L.S.0a.02]
MILGTKIKMLFCVVFLVLCCCAQAKKFPPVNPDASPEAKALLSYLYKISGNKILAGQHNAPLNGDNRLAGFYRMSGEYPAVFGQDFGFSAPGTWDGINFRQAIVDQAIQRHQQGFIITLMWHAVVPTQDEPGSFSDAIQTKLSDAQWQELTTPGTPLNERWKSQVDVIAWHLKQLRDAKVPVLWRPYHEMNGFWFWWGYREGTSGYQKLWRMMYQRFTEFHKLNNLIWVWNANEVKENVPNYKLFYPGHDVVDVLATDVYTKRFDSDNYNQLLTLAEGRPIALGEVGGLPTPEILQQQKRWAWFMSWRDPDAFFWNESESLQALMSYKPVTTLLELPWVKTKEPITLHSPVLQ